MRYIFIILPYLFLFSLSFLPDLWIFFGQEEIFRYLSILFLTIHIFYEFVFEKIPDIFFTSPLLYYPILISGMAAFLFFPIRDLRLGDGVLLLENFLLEVSAFGYTVVPDEILTGLLHSFIYSLMKGYSINPMDTYRLVSTGTGILFLTLLVFLKKRISEDWGVLLLFLSSGGSLLYYGYMENYTQVSLLMFLCLHTGSVHIEKKENQFFYTLSLALLSSVAALFHLISGFLGIALLFFCMYLAGKNENFSLKEIISNKYFYKLALSAGLPAIFLLLIIYGYFLGVSDLRIDPSLAHASHPPFLSARKIFTISHGADLFLEGTFVAFPILYFLSYLLIREKNIFLNLIKKPGNTYILLGLFGISIHFFTYNPLLGYPADWDLMGFVFIPLFTLSLHLYDHFRGEFRRFQPFFLFGFAWTAFLASQLSGTEKEGRELGFLIDANQEYFSSRVIDLKTIGARHRKNYLHTDFFLFRTEKKLRIHKEEVLLAKNLELQARFLDSKLLSDKEKWKEFLKNATEFHIQYLKWVETLH